ncbi:transposase [Streptomyces sp. MMG1121]|uniref:transposase n=1 Tax=Streptomyces sp. MMG1121 TaxID=1415544 RepID=UPI001F3AB3C2|nr:transposase [Streptomyces sp. MMG1121]
MCWSRATPRAILPKSKRPGRPPTWVRRQLIDGIRYRVRTGIPWRAPCPASRAGRAAHPTRSDARRQSVGVLEELRLPAAARDPLHHPGQGRFATVPSGQAVRCVDVD